MSDELIGALRQANHDYTNEAADLIEAQAARIERLDARIVELKAEAKLWWDENFKKQIVCEQMGKRIAELEAALAAARRDAMEEAAKIAEGEAYDKNHRTWPWWEDHPHYGRGNVAEESQLVLHCDAIAAAIRAALAGGKTDD